MDKTARLELKSLISATGSRVSGNASLLHSAGVGESLQHASPSWSRRVGLAILLLLIPIVYSVILAMMAYLHGKKQSSFGDTVLEVLSVASTLWPILFAAVLGPLLKSIALFRAERGSRLGSLEFLLTSQTTASALKNILTMGWIGSWAIGVIAIWSLSPLGGQAALRSLGLQRNPISTKTPATYYLGNNRSLVHLYYRTGAGVFQGGVDERYLLTDMRTVLSASSLTQDESEKHLAKDVWIYGDTFGFLFWNSCQDTTAMTQMHAWISVPEDEVVPYASLIGLPIRGGSFEGPGNSTMTVHFHYQTLSCGEAFDGSEWVRNGSKALWLHEPSSSIPFSLEFGDAAEFPFEFGRTGYPNIWFDFLNSSAIAEHFASSELEPQSKMQLVMGGQCSYATATKGVKRPTPILRICDVSTSYIDMETHTIMPCQRELDSPFKQKVISGVLAELPFIGASQNAHEPSILELYLRDPWGIFQRSGGAYQYMDDPFGTQKRDMDDPYGTEKLGCFAPVPPEVIERRLATALNTIIMSTYEVNVLTGGKGVASANATVPWQNTTATWTEFDKDIYKLHKPWFVTTSMSTAILLICAIANIVIRQRIRAPDFLDSLAGLTRDSPFIDVPQDGSGKSGSDRLETIKNVKVRISDVNPDEEVGKIALTTELKGPKLRWERIYA
ncbi:uncharacterized protein FTJAE_7058 [Fusarium tjaetaba]|uniref:Uncharacterized protein n=1 Tax=Fusarium tjaetaba TaxID=1567544 RepID=A0A8H5VTA0_9HYPO|nr:uncharacterized protein FTJAE_7058 [Fusarium tjaetaba]KAF5633633.1 hypothetical protein FTJAE_7058 [Fusarium tjaetaba]